MEDIYILNRRREGKERASYQQEDVLPNVSLWNQALRRAETSSGDNNAMDNPFNSSAESYLIQWTSSRIT
jgi:hypothetical protein